MNDLKHKSVYWRDLDQLGSKWSDGELWRLYSRDLGHFGSKLRVVDHRRTNWKRFGSFEALLNFKQPHWGWLCTLRS